MKATQKRRFHIYPWMTTLDSMYSLDIQPNSTSLASALVCHNKGKTITSEEPGPGRNRVTSLVLSITNVKLKCLGVPLPSKTFVSQGYRIPEAFTRLPSFGCVVYNTYCSPANYKYSLNKHYSPDVWPSETKMKILLELSSSGDLFSSSTYPKLKSLVMLTGAAGFLSCDLHGK